MMTGQREIGLVIDSAVLLRNNMIHVKRDVRHGGFCDVAILTAISCPRSNQVPQSALHESLLARRFEKGPGLDLQNTNKVYRLDVCLILLSLGRTQTTFRALVSKLVQTRLSRRVSP
jgi:hypothetical protein